VCLKSVPVDVVGKVRGTSAFRRELSECASATVHKEVIRMSPIAPHSRSSRWDLRMRQLDGSKWS
jgi:hypothetical protein